MKFGISDKGFRRLSQVSYEFTEEELTRGGVILFAMGYDVDSMSEEEKLSILSERPEYLELSPQFNVAGQWIHTLRETHLGSIQYEIEDLINSNREICVTSAEEGAYWNLEFMRRYAVVFEGSCRVLWNADVYSYLSEDTGQLTKDIRKSVEFIGEVTEGWLMPSESVVVGIQVNWQGLEKDFGDLERVQPKLQSISEYLGVSIIEEVSESKEVLDVEAVPSEEANLSCEI